MKFFWFMCLLVSALMGTVYNTSAYSSGRSIQFTIAVFWEGEVLKQYNFDALKKIKNSHPEISFIHFISPTYFLGTAKEIKDNRQYFLDILSPQKDQVGIYLGSWQQITKASEVFHRISPSFWGDSSVPCGEECGLSVPLNVYGYQDLDRMIQVSQEALDKSGLPINAELFAIAGWVHSQDIMNIAHQYQYRINFSPIPPSRIIDSLEDFPIFKWAKSNWSQFESINAPRSITTRSGHNLILIGQNLGVADYSTPQESLNFFNKILQASRERLDIAVMSINGRTAATFEPRIQESLVLIFNLATKHKVTLTFDWNSYRDNLNKKN